MAFVIEDDYIFINDYPDGSDSDVTSEEDNDDEIPEKNKRFIDFLIRCTVSDFLSNNNFAYSPFYKLYFTNINKKN